MTDEDAISQVQRRYETACNEGDLEAWMGTLTRDAVVLAPGSPGVSGGDIKTWAAETFFDPFTMRLSLEDDEVQVVGDWAFLRGRFLLTLTPKQGGDTVTEHGKYLDILQRQDGGSWKLARLAWNSDSAS